MNRFRSSHPNASTGADDPTEVLRSWRDQQREERLADTREFPELAGPVSAPAPRGRRRVPVLLVAGVGALVVVAGVAIASADDRTGEQGTSGAAVSTAPPSAATAPSTEETAPPSSADSGDNAGTGANGHNAGGIDNGNHNGDTPRPGQPGEAGEPGEAGAPGGPVDGPPALAPGGGAPAAPGPR